MSIGSPEAPLARPGGEHETYFQDNSWWYRSADPLADPFARKWVRVTDPTFHQQLEGEFRSGEMKEPAQAQPEPLTADQVRQIALDRVQQHGEELLAEYTSQFGNVLNADNAAKLFPEYNQDPAKYRVAVHPAAVWIRDELFRRALAQPNPERANRVVFTAGSNAAGKSTAVEFLDVASDAQVVFDSTLSNPEHAGQLIDKALGADKRISILYVARPLEESFRGMLERATQEGRVVTIEQLIGSHRGAAATVRKLASAHANNVRFEFTYIANESAGVRKAGIELTDPQDYTETRRRLHELLDAEYRAGRINEDIYQRIGGRGFPGEPPAGPEGSKGGGGGTEPAGPGEVRPEGRAEPAVAPSPGTAALDRPVLYHVTTPEAAESIRQNGFISSKDGELGPGVYLIGSPETLTAPKFANGEKLPVAVLGKVLVFQDGPNRPLQFLRALHGREEGARLYDGMTWDEKKWPSLHQAATRQGYVGLQVQGKTAEPKNTVIFDPAFVKVEAEPALSSAAQAAQPSPVPAAPPQIALTGTTYPYRSLLKKLGAQWNAEQKAWILDAAKEADVRKISSKIVITQVKAGAETQGAKPLEATNSPTAPAHHVGALGNYIDSLKGLSQQEAARTVAKKALNEPVTEEAYADARKHLPSTIFEKVEKLATAQKAWLETFAPKPPAATLPPSPAGPGTLPWVHLERPDADLQGNVRPNRVLDHARRRVEQRLALADRDALFHGHERQQVVEPPHAAEAERIVAAGPFRFQGLELAGHRQPSPVVANVQQVATPRARGQGLVNRMRRAAVGRDATLIGGGGRGNGCPFCDYGRCPFRKDSLEPRAKPGGKVPWRTARSGDWSVFRLKDAQFAGNHRSMTGTGPLGRRLRDTRLPTREPSRIGQGSSPADGVGRTPFDNVFHATYNKKSVTLPVGGDWPR